jgi:hypothetical protein
MNAFEFGFFDELEKIAMRSAVDPSLAQVAGRYNKHGVVFGAAAGRQDPTAGMGKMGRRDIGDSIHRANQLAARGYKAGPMLGKAMSDMGDIGHRVAPIGLRQQAGLPAYGLG